ncbi:MULTISPECIES: hypothetical protein [Microbacterium]|uniref:hypothetical protein n=1 Tax=Microbacterium TaxID=33882 RepID=UPI000D64140A|nr:MULTISPECIES: hypothetical protein [Microbacterium]
MKKPKKVPRALTDQQLALIRCAAREWRTGEGVLSPRPDGQVRDVIEVMLGTATRIGEVLAIRKRDLEMTASPPTVAINGTLVVRKRVGVIRQPKPKTDESNRVVAVPSFAAEVIRRRYWRRVPRTPAPRTLVRRPPCGSVGDVLTVAFHAFPVRVQAGTQLGEFEFGIGA